MSPAPSGEKEGHMNKPDFYRYIALLDYEKDGVHVTFPDLPGCVTLGRMKRKPSKRPAKY